ncbi:M28 family metallopeptidase [Halalkalicoccus tibetensis]|uniref:Carboxypeptidase Q n=1 Tax=Halalkalicoccus tibetensis TaxID=175632 RepID=A0ABD5V0F3_9EURY
MRLPDELVGDAYTSDFGWELLEELVAVGNRMAGQAGEAEGARAVASAFEEASLADVQIEEFEVPGWWRGEASLTADRVYDGDHEVIGLPGTPTGRVEAPIVDVGHGSLDEFQATDVEGAIAMAASDSPPGSDRWLHRMEKYAAAADAGAEAFVFRNHVEGCLPATGEIGYHNRPGPIPAVGISKELGARLRRLDEPEGALDVAARNEPTESRNVEATIGPDTDEEVLLTAHVDAHDIAEGANDNGAGCAVVAEVGRLLNRVDLETGVRLITFGSEEIGLYGAYHWAETNDLDRVKCVINVDGAGTSRNLRVGTNGSTELHDLFEEVGEEFDAPVEASDTISPHGDQWAFVQEGVPGVIAGSVSEGSGRGWGHTHADTLDKLDVRDLRAIAIQVAAAVQEAASADRTFTRRSREEIRDGLTSGYEQELKRGGRWPY